MFCIDKEGFMKREYGYAGILSFFSLLLLSACGPGPLNATQAVTLTPPPYLPFPTLYSVQALSQSDVWAVGGQFNMQGSPVAGTVLHYNGRQWSSTAVSTPLFGVSMLSATDGWAVGYSGFILHYNGQTWNSFNSPTSAVLRSIAMTSENDGWAVGYGGTLLHYNGHTWAVQTSPTTNDLYSISMASAQEGWAVGSTGTLLHYVKGAWRKVAAPSANTLYGVFMLSPQDVWAVGQNGTVIRYNGTSWNMLNSPFKSDLYSVFLSSSDEGWIGTEGSIMHYTQGELVWLNPQKYLAPGATESVFMLSAQEGWSVGMNNIVSEYQNGVWKIVYGTPPNVANP